MKRPLRTDVHTATLPGGGVRLVAPPAGFWRCRKEPFVAAVICLVLAGVATPPWAGAAGSEEFTGGAAFAGWTAIAAVWLLGLAAAYVALRMAYSRTVLTVEGDFLTV